MKKILLLLLTLVSVSSLWAQAPAKFSYQAVVRFSNNQLVMNQQVGVRISIQKGMESTTPVFTETVLVRTNDNGLVTLVVGETQPLNINWADGPYYIKSEIDPNGGMDFSVVGTTELLSVPYALYAGSTTGGENPLFESKGLNIFYDKGNVGIGTQNVDARLKVEDYNESDSSITVIAIANGGTAILGHTDAISRDNWRNIGVNGSVNTIAETAGRGVSGSVYGEGPEGFALFGESSVSNGVNYGISANALSRNGNTKSQFGGFFEARGDWDPSNGVGTGTHYGLYSRAVGMGDWNLGISTRANNAKLYSRGIQSVGFGDSTTYNQGGAFFAQGLGAQSGESFNTGIIGQAIDNRYSNTGVLGTGYSGRSPQSFVAGVIGESAGVGGYESYGVRGTSYSRNYMNMGVAGYANEEVSGDSTNYALYGDASHAERNYGVFAQANGGTREKVNYGIYAEAANATEANYAGYFAGDVTITGNLNVTGQIAKGGGTFKIDHPLDPENKYLVHSFVESPEMMNVYSGNITTDANGYATVELPGYFESANKDFRYQLTTIGSFAQSIVKEEISGNSFVVQTSAPGVKVSWQVTAVRNDPYAKRNRVEAEPLKPVSEKGRYLHPEAFGRSADRAVFRARPVMERPSRKQPTGLQEMAE